MEGAPRGVADLPVGLDYRLSRVQVLPQTSADVGQDLGEQLLALGAERQGVAVLGEAVDEILGQIRPADHPELAEKGQPAVVETNHRLGPGPRGGLSGGVGLGGRLVQVLGLPADPVLVCLGHVLEDGHLGKDPLVRRVEQVAFGPVPLFGQAHETVQLALEFPVDRRPFEERGPGPAFVTLVCQTCPLYMCAGYPSKRPSGCSDYPTGFRHSCQRRASRTVDMKGL